jgi:hypothetical protein
VCRLYRLASRFAREGRRADGPCKRRLLPSESKAVSRRDEALCEELKELAAKLGMRVREETLLREVGYRVRSGSCRVRGEDVVFLDRHATPGERVEVLLGALEGRDLDSEYVSPALRRLIERRGSAAA